ncbi:MAG: diacylglycerol kinase family lipid kinase [Clostridia bacterium]|nr:diacylglycerol kinase family lipid kinase [Clostridia bacterium]
MLKKLMLIVNPVAGKKKLKNLLLDVVEIFGKGGYATTVMVTGRRGEASEFAAFGNDFDMIVCCGGDGTLNEAISGMLQNNITIPLGYIPCGSTNDFANSMGVELDIKKCAESIALGMPLPLDVGKFNERFFTYVASFGAFTASSYSAPQSIKNVFGHAAYLFEGIKDLQSIKPYHMKFVVDDKVYEGDYVFGAVANSTSFGGIVKLKNELVSLNDGLFEVLLVKMPKNIADLSVIINALTTSNYDNDRFEFFKASKLTICPPGAMSWSLDGEYMHTDGDVTVNNLHGAVDFVK